MSLLRMILFWGMMVIAYSQGNAQSQLMTIPNPEYGLTKRAVRLAPLDYHQQIHFNVWLKLRNQTELEQQVKEIYSPASPKYQHFLTSEQITTQFLPTIKIKQLVRDFFLRHGMQAQIKNNVIEVTGSVAQIASVLHVQLFSYRYKNKRYYANATPPQLDKKVAAYISGITGLSTIPRFYPGAKLSMPGVKVMPSQTLHLSWDNFYPNVLATTQSMNGFSGANLRTTYNVNSMNYNGTSLNGQGQTIVIVDSCGNLSPTQIINDANQYSANNGLPLLSLNNNIALIKADGSPYVQCSDREWDGEIALDLESAHTLAPFANIVMVFSNGNGDLDNAEAAVIDTLRTNNHIIAGFSNAHVISNSWSGQESSGQPLEGPLALAVLNGLSVNFSSGDCGDEAKQSSECNEVLSVNYPSSSTYATAIGGSSLFVDDSWNYAFETGWGNHFSTSSTVTGDFNSGSGGGVSQYYGPVIWQSPIYNFEAGGYGVISAYVACPKCRALPDIAMLGDPQTGLKIVVNGVNTQIGGTSLACPLFSATLTLVNQKRALLNRGTTIGQAAPYLYTNQLLLANSHALNLIIPPHKIISGAFKPVDASAPISSFTINQGGNYITFSWDSALTIVEDQFWNDVVGMGSPNVPRFVDIMAGL